MDNVDTLQRSLSDGHPKSKNTYIYTQFRAYFGLKRGRTKKVSTLSTLSTFVHAVHVSPESLPLQGASHEPSHRPPSPSCEPSSTPSSMAHRRPTQGRKARHLGSARLTEEAEAGQGQGVHLAVTAGVTQRGFSVGFSPFPTPISGASLYSNHEFAPFHPISAHFSPFTHNPPTNTITESETHHATKAS